MSSYMRFPLHPDLVQIACSWRATLQILLTVYLAGFQACRPATRLQAYRYPTCEFACTWLRARGVSLAQVCKRLVDKRRVICDCLNCRVQIRSLITSPGPWPPQTRIMTAEPTWHQQHQRMRLLPYSSAVWHPLRCDSPRSHIASKGIQDTRHVRGLVDALPLLCPFPIS